MRVEVGVRELRENLSDWLDRAAAGEEILVTERGKPKAMLSAAENAYERMVREGRITPRSGTGPPELPERLEWIGEGPTPSEYLQWARGGPWPGPGPEPGPWDEAG